MGLNNKNLKNPGERKERRAVETARDTQSAPEYLGTPAAPPERGVWVEDDEGNVECVCPVDVSVVAVEVDPERDRYWYVVHLGGPVGREVRSPAEFGTKGIVRAIKQAGVWVRDKKLAEYLDQVLAERWAELVQNPRIYRDGETGIDPEALSVYEKFCEWVDVNVEQFNEGRWGLLEDGETEIKVIVYAAAFARFFADVRIRDEAERRAVLGYWKEKGWLKPGEQNRFSSVYWDPLMERARRVYVVSIPKEQKPPS